MTAETLNGGVHEIDLLDAHAVVDVTAQRLQAYADAGLVTFVEVPTDC
ncbi:hypothetical protein [Sphingomonas sp. URHD0057]|nr:hypothetical protein [Sphingomonas sp. URHD0057]